MTLIGFGLVEGEYEPIDIHQPNPSGRPRSADMRETISARSLGSQRLNSAGGRWST